MLEQYLLVATLVLANGDTLEVVGDEYPTYEMCMKENRREMEDIKAEIRKNPTVFKDISYDCEKLTVEFEEVNFDYD